MEIEVSELKCKLQESSAVSKQLSEMTSSSQEFESRVETLTKENESVTRELAALTDRLSSSEKKCEVLQAENGDFERLSETNSKLSAQLEEQLNENGLLVKKVSDLAESSASEIKDIQEKHEVELSEANRKADEVATEHSRLKQELEVLRESFKGSQQKQAQDMATRYDHQHIFSIFYLLSNKPCFTKLIIRPENDKFLTHKCSCSQKTQKN